MKCRLAFVLILFLFLSFVQKVYTQSVEDYLNTFTNSYDVEKIYVHHDRPSYMLGDTLWAKIYLVDGKTNLPIDNQTIVYAEWVSPSGELLEKYNLKSIEGSSHFDIVIDPDAKTGDYTLKVYTLYQLNFDKGFIFQKSIKVTGYDEQVSEQTESEKIILQFFPEGGYLIEGLKSRVAFKVVNNKGEELPIEGKIQNSQGLVLSPLKTLEAGLGFFYLSPKAKEKYFAVVIYNGSEYRFELPNALSKGHSMHVASGAKGEVRIILKASKNKSFKEFQLIAHHKGDIFLDQPLENKNALALNLSKSDLPYGLLHFTLFDNKNRPVAERLAFNRANFNEIPISIEVDESTLNTKQKNKISINFDDSENDWIANASVSVYNSQYDEGNVWEALNIKNYLDLQSELQGKIRNINKYFNSDDSRSRTMLELMLMTHGWSRFTWQEVLSDQPKEILFPRESAFTLSGQILKRYKDEPVKADLLFNVLEQKDFAFANITTGPDGLFHIPDLGIKDSTNIFLQASIASKREKKKRKSDVLKKSKNNRVEIKLIEFNEFYHDPTLNLKTDYLNNDIEEEVTNQVKEVINTRLGLEDIDSSLWSLNIDEITVKDSRLSKRQLREREVKRKYRARKMFYLGATEKFFPEDLYKYQDEFIDVFDLISTALPATYVSGPRGNRQLNRKGKFGEYLSTSIALNHDLVSANYLDFVDPRQIEVIEIVKGYYADALFGVGFVVRVVTKTENYLLDSKIAEMIQGTLTIAHPGFYTAKEYYARMYDGDVFDNAPDERVTLYWNPNVDLSTEAYEFEISTSNLGGQHIITLEGITSDGIPIVINKTFYVESERP